MIQASGFARVRSKASRRGMGIFMSDRSRPLYPTYFGGLVGWGGQRTPIVSVRLTPVRSRTRQVNGPRGIGRSLGRRHDGDDPRLARPQLAEVLANDRPLALQGERIRINPVVFARLDVRVDNLLAALAEVGLVERGEDRVIREVLQLESKDHGLLAAGFFLGLGISVRAFERHVLPLDLDRRDFQRSDL